MEEGGLEKALEDGIKSLEFRKAVVWLASELRTLCKLDEQVNDIASSEDAASFLLELSSFLKEIGKFVRFPVAYNSNFCLISSLSLSEFCH